MLEVKNLEKKFKFNAGFFSPEDKYVYAVNGVSFKINNNEIFGLVGESGCGKTTTARLLVQMYKPDSGEILLTTKKGETLPVQSLSGAHLRNAREKIQYIFQDPARSLNPRMNILNTILSGYRYSNHWPGKNKAKDEVVSLLEDVGLSSNDLYRRPPDFSGGQRQRIAIARALIMKPEVLICDEVVSALDVSIQSQIIKLLLRLKKEHQLSLLFISHDLAVVSYICDRVGVMYRGILVETAPAQELIHSPQHSYTKYLYASIPKMIHTKDNKDSIWQSEFTGKDFNSTIKPGKNQKIIMKPIKSNHFVSSWNGID